jgi:uncharacterized protein (TIGR00369 family)
MVALRDKLQGIREDGEEPQGIIKTLGMNIVHFGEGKSKITMPVDKRYHNPMGTLHGGIMTDLADASMGVALMSLLGSEETFTTLELKINFLRPVYEGEISAEARVVHKGRTVALVESVVKNGEGKEVARATATQMILQPK